MKRKWRALRGGSVRFGSTILRPSFYHVGLTEARDGPRAFYHVGLTEARNGPRGFRIVVTRREP